MQQAITTNLIRSIENRILLVRDQKVLLDSDLAEVYAVETRVLNQAVKRNSTRFPADFMFQLTLEETHELKIIKSQTVMLSNARNDLSSEKQSGRAANFRHRPVVFTEHGAVMLASVLSSPTAVAASVQVVRAFLRLREIVSEHQELQQRLDDLEKKYDAHFKTVFSAVKELMKPTPKEKSRKIGFLQVQNELFD